MSTKLQTTSTTIDRMAQTEEMSASMKVRKKTWVLRSKDLATCARAVKLVNALNRSKTRLTDFIRGDQVMVTCSQSHGQFV